MKQVGPISNASLSLIGQNGCNSPQSRNGVDTSNISLQEDGLLISLTAKRVDVGLNAPSPASIALSHQ